MRDGDRVKLLRTIEGQDPGGDGTVPRPSATPLEYEDDQGATFSAERHASLQNDDHLLLQLAGVLTGNTIDWSLFKEAIPMVDLSLDVDDLYSPADPVRVRARPEREVTGELLAVALDAESGEERTRQALASGDDGWYEAELGPLPEGLYRVTVFGQGAVEPVTDLVTVLADSTVRWAIVIGIDDYRGKQPTLKSAVYDAVRFCRWLLERPACRRNGSGGSSADGRRSTDGRQRVLPTKDNVLNAINEVMAESGGEGEALYFFFSGHGVTAEYANREESALVFPGIDKHQPSRRSRCGRSPSSSRRHGSWISSSSSMRAATDWMSAMPRSVGGGSLAGASPVRTRRSSSSSTRRRRGERRRPPSGASTAPSRRCSWPGSRARARRRPGRGTAARYEVRWERLATYVKNQMERKRTTKSGRGAAPFRFHRTSGLEASRVVSATLSWRGLGQARSSR